MALPTTTLTAAAGFRDTEIYVASLSGIVVGSFLTIDSEVLRVTGFGAATIVKVLRGQESSASVAHANSAVVTIGVAQDFSSEPLSALVTGQTGDRSGLVVIQDTTPQSDTETLGSGSSGDITGTLASTQVGFGSGTNTLGGDSTLIFDATNKQLTVGIKENNAGFNSYIQDWWGNSGQINLGQVYAGAGNQVAAATIVEESSTTDVQTLQILGASSKDDAVVQGLNIDAVYIGGAAKTGGVAQGIVVTAGNSNNGGALTESTGIHIVAPIGTTITNAYGLRINDQTKSGTTLNYAIDINGKFRVDPDGSGLALGNGGALKTDTTTAHTALIQAYDVDGTAYKTFGTLTNGNTPDFSLVTPSGGSMTVDATTLKQAGSTITLGGALTTSGANALTLTTTGTTNVTLPTSGTLAILGANTFTADQTHANGIAIQTTTTTAQTLLFKAYDVDGTAYKTFATLTNGNTPDLSIIPPAGGTITLQASTFKSSDGTSGVSAGPFTTITAITVKSGLVTALTGA